MSERLVYIGAEQFEVVAVLNTLANMESLVRHIAKQEDLALINVESLIYSTLIQCGVDKFLIPKEHENSYPDSLFSFIDKDKFPVSSYLDARITYVASKELDEIYDKVHEIFDTFLPKGFRVNREFIEAKYLERFLIDLLIAAKRGISCVNLYELPDMAKIERQVPPELLFPARNLINAFESAAPPLPYPKSFIKSQDIKRFEQLINSDLFSNYIARHEKLEQKSSSRTHAIKGIIESGKNVVQSNIDLLNLKQTTVSILPITTKVIDLIFGKLPGVLADYSANVMTKLLTDEKRIVVYHLDSLLDEFFFPALINTTKLALEGQDENLLKAVENNAERLKKFWKERRKQKMIRNSRQ